MKKKALLLIDLQNDFMPGGALGVRDGFSIVPVINNLLSKQFDDIIASKDWHPATHKSFVSNHENAHVGDIIALQKGIQILWPPHCIQHTFGSEFVSGWRCGKVKKIIYKGIDENIDSYSAFYDNCHLKSTHLDEYLKNQGITDLYFAGIATDYCIKYSVLDALILGYNVYVIKDGCRAVGLKEDDEADAFSLMNTTGAYIIHSDEITSTF